MHTENNADDYYLTVSVEFTCLLHFLPRKRGEEGGSTNCNNISKIFKQTPTKEDSPLSSERCTLLCVQNKTAKEPKTLFVHYPEIPITFDAAISQVVLHHFLKESYLFRLARHERKQLCKHTQYSSMMRLLHVFLIVMIFIINPEHFPSKTGCTRSRPRYIT